MSNYRRPDVTGATVFLTINLAQRGSKLLVQHVGLLREAVRQTKAERPFEIEAWVVLPDHIHCLWSMPAGDKAYGQRVGAIKARFSTALGRAGFRPPATGPHRHGVMAGRLREAEMLESAGLKPGLPRRRRGDEKGIWQKRFWEHHIRSAEDYRNHIAYCWHNPVKHGLVEHPKDWPFSSWHRDNG